MEGKKLNKIEFMKGNILSLGTEKKLTLENIKFRKGKMLGLGKERNSRKV